MAVGILEALAAKPPKSKGIASMLPILQISSGIVSLRRPSVVSIPNPATLRTLRPLSPIFAASNGKPDQVEGLHSNSGYHNPGNEFIWVSSLLKFARNNFLPLALVSGVALGLAAPKFGCLAHKYGLPRLSTFGIFLFTGLMLRSGEIGAAMEAWPAGIFGLVSILFFSPCFSEIISKVQLSPREFVTGIAVFCCMPTTLSSGVALTQLVRGNSALALAITVTSNLLGILIVPFSLSKFVAAGVGVALPTKQLFKSLVIMLLVPLIFGKVIRELFSRAAEYVDSNRQLFSMASAILLSLVPWIQVSRSRSLLLSVKPAIFLLAIGMGILLHLILLGMNALVVKFLSAISVGEKSVFSKKENARAFIIVSSQKTLPVMVAVVEQLGGALGEPGLLVLPCVAAHISQIIIDSILVNFWLRQDRVAGKEL